MTRPDSTLITVILDRSSSMGPLQKETVTGFNEFLKGQKAAPGKAKISLIQFDTKYEICYLAKDIQEVPVMTSADYSPRGWTALYDAVGRGIIETGKYLSDIPETERPGVVIFVIDTDGDENSSREFDAEKIKAMIEEQTNTWKWEFVFLGANQDAILKAADMGIKAGSAMNTSATMDGMGPKFASASAYATRSRQYGASGQSMGSNSFSDEEREANNK